MPRSAATKGKKGKEAKAPPSRGAFATGDDDDDNKKNDATAKRNASNPRGGQSHSGAAEREPPATPDANRRASSRRRAAGLDAFMTPVSKKLKTTGDAASTAAGAAVAAVTPDERAAAAEAEALSQYVPKYIHKNLDYKWKGEKELSALTLDVYRLVSDHYAIPANFEQLRAFGPLSGTSYEERAIQAYSIGKLPPKSGSEAVSICTCCASLGHTRSDCPTLV